MTSSKDKILSDTDIPVMFMGGFGYGEHRNNRVISEIRKLGYGVLDAMPDQPYRKGLNQFTIKTGEENGQSQQVGWLRAMRESHRKAAPQVSSNFQQYRMSLLRDQISDETKPNTKIDVVAQSADAMAALLYAEKYPDRVDNLVLVNPAGIVAQPQFLRSAANVMSSMAKSGSQKRRQQQETAFETRIQKRKDTKLGGFAMATSVALSSHIDVLRHIRERDNPPGIAIVLGLNDDLVHPEQVIAELRSEDVDSVLITDGAHGINGDRQLLEEIMRLKDSLHDRDIGEEKTLAEKMTFFGEISDKRKQELLALAA